MEFSASSIVMALFTGVVAGLASYFASYAKVKAEVRAATEDLKQTAANLAVTTRAVEVEKARVAADALLAAEQRKTLYALVSATQGLVHSMCWLSWDTAARKTLRLDLAKGYDAEAHKLLPEIFSQLALLKILDAELHARVYPYATQIAGLDVQFGEAIVLADFDLPGATSRLSELFQQAHDLQFEVNALFGGPPSPDAPKALHRD
jgi:hypothetical protein